MEKKMKIPEFFKSRINGSLSLAGLLIVLYLCLQISSCFHEKSVDSTANQQSTEATRQIGIAEKSTANANISQAARQSEDIVREKVIEPRRRNDIAKSADARSKTARAKQNYEDSKIFNKHDSRSDSDLHVSNCRELVKLYPKDVFEHCN